MNIEIGIGDIGICDVQKHMPQSQDPANRRWANGYESYPWPIFLWSCVGKKHGKTLSEKTTEQPKNFLERSHLSWNMIQFSL